MSETVGSRSTPTTPHFHRNETVADFRSYSSYPTYSRKPTTNDPMPPKTTPRTPQMLLRPIMPDTTENRKISRKNHREFHHRASFAEKHTTNQSKPATANIRLVMPNLLYVAVSSNASSVAKSFKKFFPFCLPLLPPILEASLHPY